MKTKPDTKKILRNRLSLIVFSSLWMGVFSCNSATLNHAHSKRPNILFIMIDDLRDWTGYANTFPNVKTPNLDQLAGSGLVFSNAYCSAPVCAPSRTALLTGLNPGTTGIYENGQVWEGTLRTHETLTQRFMNAGYHVAGYGKIYHGKGDSPNWHEYEYGEYSPLPHSYENYYALGNPLDVPDSITGDWKRVSNAVSTLEKDINQPLFLACGLVRPHTPGNVPRKYFDLYDEDAVDVPETIERDLEDLPPIGLKVARKTHRDQYGKSLEWTHQAIVDSSLWKTNIRAYLASITYADAQVGRLLAAWKKSKYSKNGIIVLMGDHGWHLGEKEHWSKRTLWEVGTKTPLIISAPGLTKKGGLCNTPVSLLDIYPTLLDLCRLPPKEGLEGLSLKKLLEDPSSPWQRPALTTWGKDNISLRAKEWRYIRYCDGTEELYSEKDDPREWHNLIQDLDATSAKVIEQFQKWIPRCKAPNRFAKNRTSWFEKEGITKRCQGID